VPIKEVFALPGHPVIERLLMELGKLGQPGSKQKEYVCRRTDIGIVTEKSFSQWIFCRQTCSSALMVILAVTSVTHAQLRNFWIPHRFFVFISSVLFVFLSKKFPYIVVGTSFIWT
jgi:hypothetical protein